MLRTAEIATHFCKNSQSGDLVEFVLGLKDMSALRAATKLVGYKPANSASNDSADPCSIHRAKRPSGDSDLRPKVSTCCGSHATSNETLRVIVVEDSFALRANDVGLNYSSWVISRSTN